jgi:hypothetical protein
MRDARKASSLRGDRGRRRRARAARLRADGLAKVARKALQIMHFDSSRRFAARRPSRSSTDRDTACVAACYRCVMSYYNQPDHELLDRRDSACAPCSCASRPERGGLDRGAARAPTSAPALLRTPTGAGGGRRAMDNPLPVRRRAARDRGWRERSRSCGAALRRRAPGARRPRRHAGASIDLGFEGDRVRRPGHLGAARSSSSSRGPRGGAA